MFRLLWPFISGKARKLCCLELSHGREKYLDDSVLGTPPEVSMTGSSSISSRIHVMNVFTHQYFYWWIVPDSIYYISLFTHQLMDLWVFPFWGYYGLCCYDHPWEFLFPSPERGAGIPLLGVMSGLGWPVENLSGVLSSPYVGPWEQFCTCVVGFCTCFPSFALP